MAIEGRRPLRRRAWLGLFALAAAAALLPLGSQRARIALWTGLLAVEHEETRGWAVRRLLSEGTPGFEALLCAELGDQPFVDEEGEDWPLEEYVFWVALESDPGLRAIASCARSLSQERRVELLEELRGAEEPLALGARGAIIAAGLEADAWPVEKDPRNLHGTPTLSAAIPELDFELPAVDEAIARALRALGPECHPYWLHEAPALGPATTLAILELAETAPATDRSEALAALVEQGEPRARIASARAFAQPLRRLADLAVPAFELGGFDEVTPDGPADASAIAILCAPLDPLSRYESWPRWLGELDAGDPERAELAAIGLALTPVSQSLGLPIAERLLATPGLEPWGARMLGALTGPTAPRLPLWEAALEDERTRSQALAGLLDHPLPAALRPRIIAGFTDPEPVNRALCVLIATADDILHPGRPVEPAWAALSTEDRALWELALGAGAGLFERCPERFDLICRLERSGLQSQRGPFLITRPADALPLPRDRAPELLAILSELEPVTLRRVLWRLQSEDIPGLWPGLWELSRGPESPITAALCRIAARAPEAQPELLDRLRRGEVSRGDWEARWLGPRPPELGDAPAPAPPAQPPPAPAVVVESPEARRARCEALLRGEPWEQVAGWAGLFEARPDEARAALLELAWRAEEASVRAEATEALAAAEPAGAATERVARFGLWDASEEVQRAALGALPAAAWSEPALAEEAWARLRAGLEAPREALERLASEAPAWLAEDCPQPGSEPQRWLLGWRGCESGARLARIIAGEERR